jgi:hypothetical protein
MIVIFRSSKTYTASLFFQSPSSKNISFKGSDATLDRTWVQLQQSINGFPQRNSKDRDSTGGANIQVPSSQDRIIRLLDRRNATVHRHHGPGLFGDLLLVWDQHCCLSRDFQKFHSHLAQLISMMRMPNCKARLRLNDFLFEDVEGNLQLTYPLCEDALCLASSMISVSWRQGMICTLLIPLNCVSMTADFTVLYPLQSP